MTTHEHVRLYRATAIGRLTWPKRRRPREAREKPGKTAAPHSSKYRPAASASPDASPWDRVGHGGRAKLVMDTCRDLAARGARWRPIDVAQAIGAPTTAVASHMKRLRGAGLIPGKRAPYSMREGRTK